MANTAVIRISKELAELINQYRDANCFSNNGDALLNMLRELRTYSHESGVLHGIAHIVGGRDLGSEEGKKKLQASPTFMALWDEFSSDIIESPPLLEQFLKRTLA